MTLLNVLNGSAPPSLGTVLYDGRDLYANTEELQRRVGYVPQDNVLHGEITVRQTLEYAAELRFPPDVPIQERRAWVEEVLTELGLSDPADIPVHLLSGGQRKRTNVAVELLTRPRLLLLDEPTSGLDPGYEKVFMNLLRRLADGGRTIVVVTHSVLSLAGCDRVLYLAPGGRMAFYGPPDEAMAYFGRSDAADVFQDLGSPGGDWGGTFRRHSMYERYVSDALSPEEPRLSPSPQTGPAAPRGRGVSQVVTLVRRYLALVVSDRRYLGMLVLQAPLLGLLILAAAAPDGLNPVAAGGGEPTTLALFLVLSATWLGTSNAAREIVKERGIFRRERASGLSVSAYLASKAIVLAGFTVVQAAVLVGIAVLRQGGPRGSLVLGWPLGELILDVALTGLAAMALGLLISALAGTPDKALALLPLALVAQLVLSGAFSVSGTPGLRQLGYLSGARWGLASVAASVDLTGVVEKRQAQASGAAPAPAPAGAPAVASPALAQPLSEEAEAVRRFWRHRSDVWAIDAAMLLVLTVAALGGAGLVIQARERSGSPHSRPEPWRWSRRRAWTLGRFRGVRAGLVAGAAVIGGMAIAAGAVRLVSPGSSPAASPPATRPAEPAAQPSGSPSAIPAPTLAQPAAPPPALSARPSRPRTPELPAPEPEPAPEPFLPSDPAASQPAPSAPAPSPSPTATSSSGWLAQWWGLGSQEGCYQYPFQGSTGQPCPR